MKLRELLNHPEAQDLYVYSSTNICSTAGTRDCNFYDRLDARLLKLEVVYENEELIKEVSLVPNYFYPLLEGVSLAYGGSQYGYFNPDLGDGRSYIYTQVSDREQNLYDVVVKGRIKNKYSSGNGLLSPERAVVEKYIGEELYKKGIDSDRCLYIIYVYEEGKEKPQTAISVKLRRCSIRLGTLQLYYKLNKYGLIDAVCEYLTKYYYSVQKDPLGFYDDLFIAICRKWGVAVKNWQDVGFLHGRLSSDNFSLLGDAMDLSTGSFNPEKDPNVSFHEDLYGYYSFGRQPEVVKEYIYILADCMRPYIRSYRTVEKGIEEYYHEFD